MGLKHKNNVTEGLVCDGGRDQGGRETREERGVAESRMYFMLVFNSQRTNPKNVIKIKFHFT